MSYELETTEGLFGTIIAFEGVRDGMSILHGPTGCKMYPSDMSERLFVQRNDTVETRNPLLNEAKYYFYQPRLPCTLLDGNGLVLGASERLDELYDIVRAKGPSMIGVINAPSASLTGEDLGHLRSDVPTVGAHIHDFSAPMYVGFSDASVRIVDAIAEERPVRERTINVFGLSIWHLRFEDDIEELRRLFALCGIGINCFLCAGSTVQAIRDIPSAELNLVIDSDFGLRAAEYCKDRFGTPFVEVCPIGFPSVERMVSEVCTALCLDPKDAMDDIARWRRVTANKVSVMERRYVRIRGRSFSIHGTPCMARTLSEFVYGYLGLVPVAVQCGVEPDWFDGLDMPIEDDIWNVYSDIAFGSGNEIASLSKRGIVSGGVEITEPSRTPINILPRPSMGAVGAARIVEDVLNMLIRITDRL